MRRDRDAADAAAVAERFLSAVGAERWDSAGAVLDSAEAMRFRDQHLALLATIAEHEGDIILAGSSRRSTSSLSSIPRPPGGR